ncbi:DUF397 domain-containing protein [Nocardiopsis chromatogenes]|uniref:DUF397 domain-containing protein n=1 Tax=Nocardiopsis chromatogenes TaxID=280239 RepID=UPI000345F884|nr:DUF397 domain-containing protein [Nocardiopsis chromatogenes]
MPDISHFNFRKSSYSSGKQENCVEAAVADGRVTAVRDSQNRAFGHLTVPAAEWNVFVEALKHETL